MPKDYGWRRTYNIPRLVIGAALVGVFFLLCLLSGCISLNQLAKDWPQPEYIVTDRNGALVQKVYKP